MSFLKACAYLCTLPIVCKRRMASTGWLLPVLLEGRELVCLWSDTQGLREYCKKNKSYVTPACSLHGSCLRSKWYIHSQRDYWTPVRVHNFRKRNCGYFALKRCWETKNILFNIVSYRPLIDISHQFINGIKC